MLASELPRSAWGARDSLAPMDVLRSPMGLAMPSEDVIVGRIERPLAAHRRYPEAHRAKEIPLRRWIRTHTLVSTMYYADHKVTLLIFITGHNGASAIILRFFSQLCFGALARAHEDKALRPMKTLCRPRQNLLCNSVLRRKNLACALGLAALI